MTEKDVAIRMLKKMLTLRGAEKGTGQGVTEEFIEGYEQALEDMAAWLVEEFAITLDEFAGKVGNRAHQPRPASDPC